jgi:hypothetical protein
MEPLGDVGETLAAPTMAKGDRDRDDLWPTPRRHASEGANERVEQIVRVQFVDEQRE